MQQQTVMSSLGRLASLDAASPSYVIDVVDLILGEAALVGASDIHLLPTAAGLEVLYRIDGVLHLAGTLPRPLLPNVVARLKLLANMITYRTDIPQEGRILESGGDVEKRVSTFPTHFGEKVVIRMFGGITEFQRLRGPGAARGDPADPLRAPERDLRRDPVHRARRQRQDHDPLHLPPRAGRAPRAAAAA